MIRMAKEKDIPKIEELLSQVCLVHHKGRPDIFKIGTKYTEEELKELKGLEDSIEITENENPAPIAEQENEENRNRNQNNNYKKNNKNNRNNNRKRQNNYKGKRNFDKKGQSGESDS